MADPSENESACPRCGRRLPQARLAWLCPACAWSELAESEEGFEAGPRAAGGLRMRVPGHEVLEEIARGGMGIVYKAREFHPRRMVALKMLLPHQHGSVEMLQRFELEVRALTELNHPAILPVYQVGQQDGLPYFTMKLAAGGSLAQRKDGFLGNWRGIAELVGTVSEAVQFAHERGVLHRDLKPGNILFDESGRAYVSDFGLAKLAGIETDLTRSADLLGTPHYMAPEVAARSAGHATTASDIYSLGAILYELLAGRPPFEAEGVPALLRKILEEAPIPPSRLTRGLPARRPPRDLEIICLKCLAKVPRQRYGSAGELAADLRHWLAGSPIQARRESAVERIAFWVRRRPVVAGLSFGLLLAVALSTALLAHANRRMAGALRASRQAETNALESLFASLLSKARAQQQSRRMGQRYDTLDSVRQAARIHPSLALRNVAAAALAQPDLRHVRKLPYYFPRAYSMIGVSPDFQLCACGQPGGFVVNGCSNGAVVRQFNGAFGHSADYLSFSPDGKWLSVLDVKRNAEIRPVDGGDPVWTLAGSKAAVCFPAFHSDGTCFAYGGANGLVGLRSIHSGSGFEEIVSSTGANVVGLAFAHVGDRLAVARTNGLELWKAATAERLWSLPLWLSPACPAWSPNDRAVAVTELESGDVFLVHAADGTVERTFHGHSQSVVHLGFLPDGMTLVSQGTDHLMRFWNVNRGTEILQCPSAPHGLVISRDSRMLGFAPEDKSGAVFEMAPAEVFRRFSELSPGLTYLLQAL